MEAAARGCPGLLHGVGRQNVSDLGDQAGGGEGFFHVVAFQVDIGVDFVCEAVVPLVSFKPDIVSGCADP